MNIAAKKIFIGFSLLGILIVPAMALAGNVPVINIPNPLCPNPGTSGCIDSLPSLITAIGSYIMTLIGSVAVLVFIWAGMLFLWSAWEPSKLNDAKKAVWYAIIGIAIALSGQGLLSVIQAVIRVPSGTITTSSGTGACCMGGGTCNDQETQSYCTSNSSVPNAYRGDNSTCAASTCP